MVEINGQQYQHATTKAIAIGTGGTFPLKTFKKISYESGAEKTRTNDAQGQTDGYTIKAETIEASISMKLSEWFEFRKFLLASSMGLGVLQSQFQLPVMYGPRLASLKCDTLNGCMIQKEPRTSEDGQEALTVDLPLFVFSITYADGQPIVYEP